MKKLLFILVVSISLFSCKKDESKPSKKAEESSLAIGKKIFEGEGNCIACHQIEQTIIGPSLQEITTIYKAKNASIVSFLKEESEPIVDPSKYEIMKTNFAITKTMSDAELKAIEEYIYSTSK